jgi:hypothetical protein
MTAVRGYLAVLGTIALLTASVVVVLLVGSGVAEFDPSSDAGRASSPLERIRVDDDAAAASGLRRGGQRSGSRSGGGLPLPPLVRTLPAPPRDALGGTVEH